MDYSQPVLPLISLETDPSDFDYAAFLQGEDVDYLAEESSASGTSNTLAGRSLLDVVPAASDTSSNSITAPFMTPSPANSQGTSPPKRLERRGHTKSRQGCFNCKRRRIKACSPRPKPTCRDGSSTCC